MAEEARGPQILFVIQVLFPLAQVGELVPEVGNLVLEAPDAMSAAAKASFLDAVGSALLNRIDQLQYVCWDLVDDPDEAVNEYWQWIEGTAADARSEAPWKHGDEAQFGFVTILLLAQEGSSTAQMLLDLDDVDDDQRTSADHVSHMLSALGALDCSGLTSDVVMVRPGDGGYGVMESLLAEDTYHHLQPIL
jgi:hypothetical protein